MPGNKNENYYYAIVDVLVTDSAEKVTSEYTGVQDIKITNPYIYNMIGERLNAKDVNNGIGGDTTTIWVKYEFLPQNSSKKVLTGIAAVEWTNWEGCTPGGISLPDSYEPVSDGWQRANGGSFRKKGALTTNTQGKIKRIGLCVKYEPMNTVTSFISNLFLTFSKEVTYPIEAIANDGIWKMQKGILDIHKGGGGDFVFICFARTLLPIRKFSLLQYNTHLFEGSLAAISQKYLHTTKVVYKDKIRMDAIVKNIVRYNPDLVCLQEVWGEDFRENFKNSLCDQYPYFYYIVPGKNPSEEDVESIIEAYINQGMVIDEAVRIALKAAQRLMPKFTNGLMVFCKYPLISCDYEEYKDIKDPEDKLGKKGLLTFSIQVPVMNDIKKGCIYKTIYIGTTHAPTSLCIGGEVSPKADTYIALGSAAQKMFFNRTYDSILLGDFNVHYYQDKERKELEEIMEIYGAVDIVAQCLPVVDDCYTDWPERNKLTKALEGDMKRGKDRIDYVYLLSAQDSSKSILKLEDAQIKVFKDWNIYDQNPDYSPLDLSDHNPVLVSFDFKE